MGALPARSDLMVSLGFAALALVEIALTPPWGCPLPSASVSPRVWSSSPAASRSVGCTRSLSALLVFILLSGVAWPGPTATVCGRSLRDARLLLGRATRNVDRIVVVLATAAGYRLFVSSFEESDDVWDVRRELPVLHGADGCHSLGSRARARQRHALSRYDAERAVEDERARIARELHDVVGHALGMIVVQAEGERAQLAPDAPESTRETLAVIARGGRDALDDVRRLLVVLRVRTISRRNPACKTCRGCSRVSPLPATRRA